MKSLKTLFQQKLESILSDLHKKYFDLFFIGRKKSRVINIITFIFCDNSHCFFVLFMSPFC